MLRKLIIAACTVALPLVVAAATAASDIPSEVNLHNGYVTVRDIRPSNSPYVMVYERQLGGNMGALRSRPGDVLIANRCCILAGTENQVRVEESPRNAGQQPTWMIHYSFVPRLCNIHGIPFGFADIVIAEENGHTVVKRVDERCPE